MCCECCSDGNIVLSCPLIACLQYFFLCSIRFVIYLDLSASSHSNIGGLYHAACALRSGVNTVVVYNYWPDVHRLSPSITVQHLRLTAQLPLLRLVVGATTCSHLSTFPIHINAGLCLVECSCQLNTWRFCAALRYARSLRHARYYISREA